MHTFFLLLLLADPRAQIQARYDALAAAFAREDVDAAIAFRTRDFATVGPDGRTLGYDEMAEYTRNWFRINEPPIVTTFTIQNVEMRGSDEAAVTVLQKASRMQQLAGKLRKVEHDVVQRETWVRTAEGWKIRGVDRVRDQRRWVDGKRVDPTRPFDPDAPEFPAEEATKREIEQRYRNLVSAWNRKDLDTLRWMGATGDPSGEVKEVRVSGDEVTAIVMRNGVEQTDTWTRTNDGWKLVGR